MSRTFHIVLIEIERQVGGHCDLCLDQIDPGDHFRNGMLDLNPGIDFNEEEVVIFINDELHRSGIAVVRPADHPYGSIADFFSAWGWQIGTGSLLDQLLMPSLDTTIPFIKVNDLAMVVGNHLHFNMTGIANVAFQINPTVSEGGLRFGSCLVQRRNQRLLRFGNTHSFAAATCGRLDQHGEPDFACDFQRTLFIFHKSVASGHDRNLIRDRHGSRRVLVAQLFHRSGTRTDKLEPA